MNTCESASKDREMNQAKVIVTPELKQQRGSEDGLALSLRGQQHPSVNSRHLTQHYFLGGTWKPCISPALTGKPTVREAYRSAGLGCWKKRMPSCNVVDMGLNVTQHESVPTSNWSFMAREFVESP